MRRIAITTLLVALVGCDGDPDPRTLTLDLTGDMSAAVGEDVSLTAALRMDHDDALQEQSRLAIYLPEGPAVGDVVSGPTVEASGLTGEVRAVAVERTDEVPETLLDYQPPGIPLGPQTLDLTVTYTCETDGMATLYVDATFRGDEPSDNVNRTEMVTVTCGTGAPMDGGPGSDAGPMDEDAGADDAGTQDDAGATDGGAGDAGANDSGPSVTDGG